jgi:hypothetical protein
VKKTPHAAEQDRPDVAAARTELKLYGRNGWFLFMRFRPGQIYFRTRNGENVDLGRLRPFEQRLRDSAMATGDSYPHGLFEISRQ